MNANPAGVGNLKVPGDGRRKSFFKTVGAGKGMSEFRRMTLTMRTKSDISNENIKPQLQKENTYKMEPDTKFSVASVTKTVYQLLEDECSDIVYDQDSCSKLTCMLAERIKDRVKELGFTRHKIAVNLIIGQAGDQGLEVVSRSCWNTATDNYACISYTNKTMMIVALVYGIYFE